MKMDGKPYEKDWDLICGSTINPWNPSLDMTSFCSRYSLSLIVSRWHAQTWKISNTSYNQHDLLWYCYRWGAVSAIIQNQKNTHKVGFGIREHSSHWFQIVLFVCPGLTASRQSLCCTCTYSFLFMYSCIPMIVTKIMNLPNQTPTCYRDYAAWTVANSKLSPWISKPPELFHRRIPATEMVHHQGRTGGVCTAGGRGTDPQQSAQPLSLRSKAWPQSLWCEHLLGEALDAKSWWPELCLDETSWRPRVRGICISFLAWGKSSTFRRECAWRGLSYIDFKTCTAAFCPTRKI